MLCRVEMPTNEQIFGRFYRYKMMRKGAPGRASIIMIPAVVLVLLLFGFSMGMSWVAMGAVVLVGGGYLAYSLYLKPNQLFRKKEGVALQTEVYIFTDTGFTRSVRSEEGGFPDNYSGQYNVLVSAVETRQDFFLFTGPNQAYLVDKEYFTKGSPELLRQALKDKMGDKFKSK